MKIVVTGHKGRLGSELLKQGCVPFSVNDIECDVTSQELIKKALEACNPDIIINCAAVTRVDACETDADFARAIQVNTGGVSNLLEMVNNQVPIIHISTDYVFSGRDGPYKEKDKPVWETSSKRFCPVNNYGWSKLGGEIMFVNWGSFGNCLVRTTGLYGNGSDFVASLIDHLKNSLDISVTNELHSNHTYIPHLAEALIRICHDSKALRPQIVHLASSDILTRYEFALMVANTFGYDPKLIHPVSNKDIFGWVAARPTKGGLVTKYAEKRNLPIYSTLEGVQALCQKLTTMPVS